MWRNNWFHTANQPTNQPDKQTDKQTGKQASKQKAGDANWPNTFFANKKEKRQKGRMQVKR